MKEIEIEALRKMEDRTSKYFDGCLTSSLHPKFAIPWKIGKDCALV